MIKAPLRRNLRRTVRNPWWQAAGGLLLIAVATTAALGGFKEASSKSKPLPRFVAGQRFDSGALAVTPLRAWVSDRQPGKPAYAWQPVQYLVLQVVLENRTGSSTGGFGYPLSDVILLAPDNQPVTAKALYYSQDHIQVGDLGPRLPTRVDLVWEVPKGVAVGGTRSWGMYRRAFKQKAHLNEESAWVQAAPGARFELTVEDRRPPTGTVP